MSIEFKRVKSNQTKNVMQSMTSGESKINKVFVMKQLQLRCVAPSFVYFCFVFTACGQTLGTPLILIQFQDPGALTGGHDHISLIPSHNGHNGPSLMTQTGGSKQLALLLL